eukprot:41445-Prorocentrum_minimum.AAC.1
MRRPRRARGRRLCRRPPPMAAECSPPAWPGTAPSPAPPPPPRRLLPPHWALRRASQSIITGIQMVH